MNVRMLVAVVLVLISASACKANTPSGAASAPASAQQQAPAPAPQASQASAPASRASAPQPVPPARGVEQKKVEKKDEKQTPAPRSAITPKFTVFDTVEECRASVLLGQVQPYKPTTKAPFQGVGGWEKKVVPEGGACLGRAHVMEDGAPKNGKAVYVPAGFVYWQHVSGSYRMAECSNPFEEISFFHKKEEIAPSVVQQETKTVVINERIEKKIEFVETVECVQGNRKVPGVIENGKVKCPDLEIAAPITINEPIRVQPRVVAPPPVVVPPAAPAPKAEAPCTDCHAEARVLAEEAAPHGVCGIRAVDGQRRTVGLIQIDNYNGRVRIARVAEWRGRPTHRPVLTGLPSSSRRDCNEDQAAIERHWNQVIKMLELPLDCRPAGRQQYGQPQYVQPIPQ